MLKSRDRTEEVPVMGMEEWSQAGNRIIGISNLQQGFRVRQKSHSIYSNRGGDALCLQRKTRLKL